MARGRRTSDHHGWVVIDKPAGWTSHDVVAKVRRIVGERRAGHAGTLDPAATGVLPIAIGLATRTVEYLAEADKSYRAWIRFGVTTDTADADGSVIAEADASGLSLDDVLAPLDAFQGTILQVPPAHSAIRIDGQRAYDLARRGEEVTMPERTVTIHSLDVVSWDAPVVCLDITCSKGTYIRSIARDLGEAAGPGAHLDRLIRTRTGPFSIDDALSIDSLAETLPALGWDSVSLPPDAVLAALTRVDLDEAQSVAWQQGKPIPMVFPPDSTHAWRAYNATGTWVGVGNADPVSGMLRPHKVIPVE